MGEPLHIRVTGEQYTLCCQSQRGDGYHILIFGLDAHRDIYSTIGGSTRERICPQCYAMVEHSLMISALQGEET